MTHDWIENSRRNTELGREHWVRQYGYPRDMCQIGVSNLGKSKLEVFRSGHTFTVTNSFSEDLRGHHGALGHHQHIASE